MVETLTLEEATLVMRGEGIKMSKDTLKKGIQQGFFPFGVCIERDDGKAPWCYIFTVQLEDWMNERRRSK